MVTVEIKNMKGEKVEELELSPDVFGIKPNDHLISQVYIALHANKRKPLAHTKDRGERAGSNIKPWRQKGTGRARTGSVRNPIWRKGGVVFGPTKERNFTKKINKKQNNLALRMVLSGKVASNQMVVVDSFKLEESKTKRMAEGLRNLKIDKKAIMVFSSSEKEQIKTSRNIEFVSNSSTSSVNVFDLLNNKFLVVSKSGIRELEQLFSKSSEEDSNKQRAKNQAKK